MKKTAIYVLLVIVFCSLLAVGTYFIYNAVEMLDTYISQELRSRSYLWDISCNFAFGGLSYICCIITAIAMVFVHNSKLGTPQPESNGKRIFFNIFLVINLLIDLILAFICIYEAFAYEFMSLPITETSTAVLYVFIGGICVILAVLTIVALIIFNASGFCNSAYYAQKREEKKQARIAKLQDELNNLKKD